MKFKSAEAVEQIVWEMKLADYPRGLNRSKINEVFNGFPPYTDDEVIANNIATNVNFLDGSKIAHEARKQFSNAFLVPSPLFTVDIDHGPVWKRREWGSKITKEVNKIITESQAYVETRRSVFALDVLHGIGPSVWPNRHSWRPRCKGVEDVLVPSGTLLDLENLPFFAVYEQYTAAQLIDIINKPNVDPGWRIPVVKQAINWVNKQAQQLMSASWPEVWSPEKMSERIKEDSGLYASDRVPTVDCWRFFWWNDEGKQSGWSQKIVLDAWGEPGAGGIQNASPVNTKTKYGLDKSSFLYDSGNRKFAASLKELIHFQFADASCVAPFRYHSIRGLGFLLYSVCHLQNRLRCKFTDALFENMLQYFRVNNPTDAERAQRINLADKTPIPDGVQFVKQEERWKVDKQLVEMGFELNRQTMDDNSAGYTQDYDLNESGQETATRTMAKLNAGTSLISSALNQAYIYQAFHYQEICRRFCRTNSDDPDVRRFRANVLRAGVPVECLNVAMWNIQPVRVIGGGNRTLQIATTDKLMAVYTKLDPQAQNELKRLFIAVNSDDYDMASRWVPDQPHQSDSAKNAINSIGTLMQGIPVGINEGGNHEEEIIVYIGGMIRVIQKIESTGGMPTQDQLIGLQTLGQQIGALIQVMAQDAKQPHRKGEPQDQTLKEKVKKWSDDLAKLMKQVAMYQQRLQQAQMQRNGENGQDMETMGKVKAMVIQAKTKADLAAQSHAQRTAQRQLQFEQQFKQDQMRGALELQNRAQEIALENSRMTSLEE